MEQYNNLLKNEIEVKEELEISKKSKILQNWLLLVANFMLAIATGVAVYFAVLYYQDQGKHANISEGHQDFGRTNLKINKTIELLNRREDWYKDYSKYGTDIQLNIALSWDGYIKDERIIADIWKKSNKEERLNLLIKNMAVRRIFDFFEKTKMLHKKGQIDLDYFYNDIFFSIVRLNNIDTTKSPSADEYINKLREHFGNKNVNLYDGYYYCKDSIIDYDKTLEKGIAVIILK